MLAIDRPICHVPGVLLVPYLRVSDEDRQSVDSSGQLHAIRQWAAEHGHTLTEPCQDELPGSLGPDRRPGLASALAQCTRAPGRRKSRGQPDGIVAWDRKRLCRDAALCGYLAWTAKTGGFRLLTVDGYDSADGSESALFANGMHGILGDLERRGIGRATAKALRDRKAQGRVYSRVVPFGQRVVDGCLEPEPGELATLARMRELAALDPSPTAIAHALNREGRLNRGRPWVRQTVTYLLKRTP